MPVPEEAGMAIRIGINGFGRIGRTLFRRAADAGLEVAAINDPAPVDQLAYLLRYDSAYGRYHGTIQAAGGQLVVDGRAIPVTGERDPARIPWARASVRSVAEC